MNCLQDGNVNYAAMSRKCFKIHGKEGQGISDKMDDCENLSDEAKEILKEITIENIKRMPDNFKLSIG